MLINTLPSEWKLPLNLTVGFHLFVLFCAMVLPGLIQRRPIVPEVTTIDLVNIAEPTAQNEPAAPAAKQATKQPVKPKPAPPSPPVPPKPAETIKPEVVKQIPPPIAKPTVVPVPEPAVMPEPAAPPAPVEAISLKPLKQKVKKEIKEIPDTRVEDAKIRKDALNDITRKLQEEAKQEAKQEATKEAAAQETIKQQRQLAAAREEARRTELEARMAAADAKNALRDQLRASTSASVSPAGSSPSSASNAQRMGVLEQQYYATLMGHIQQYWLPPDVKSWDPNLLAVVSITIASDGKIVSQVFEKESGDKLFDQFVLKTLEAANPLPPLPPALQKERFEVGLNFKPSGIQ